MMRPKTGAAMLTLGLLAITSNHANAQQRLRAKLTANDQPTMRQLQGVWIEGPGYDITYGGTYEACAMKCLAAGRCQMIEYYRPEKKCNMYEAVRPTLKGGSSLVALKTANIRQ